jgi:hypothetical protein
MREDRCPVRNLVLQALISAADNYLSNRSFRAGAFRSDLLNGSRRGLSHALFHLIRELGEILDEQIDELRGCAVIVSRIGPRATRVEDCGIDTWNRDRHFEAEIRILAEFGILQGAVERCIQQRALAPADVVALLGSRHGRSARTTAFLALLRQSLAPPPWRTLGRAESRQEELGTRVRR